jgi:hypothetical protein
MVRTFTTDPVRVIRVNALESREATTPQTPACAGNSKTASAVFFGASTPPQMRAGRINKRLLALGSKGGLETFGA